MSNHYKNIPSNNSKIQDFYSSQNHNGGVNILDQRGFCTRNSEESKIKKEYPFITLINNSEIIIKNDNFRNATTAAAPINYNQNSLPYISDNKNTQNEDSDNNRDIANQRISKLSPFNNNVVNYKYMTPTDFQYNNNKEKNYRDTSNERISSFQSINQKDIKDNSNYFFDERNMFNENKNENDFKQSHNNRLSELGQLPNNSAFPINNQRNLYEIKSINTRNIKEK